MKSIFHGRKRIRGVDMSRSYSRSLHCTRRRALAWLGAGAAASLCPAPCLAGKGPPQEFSFLVITDTHVGYRGQASAAAQWVQTAKELTAARGDFVLHLGDIVDGGRDDQYPIYLETRKLIGKPVHEVPGNHDPAAMFEKHIRKPIDMVLDHKGVRFLLVNNSRPDSHDGFFSAAQLDWIDRQCGEAARKGLYVVLCSHVPVHENKHPDRGWHVKPADGQKELYALAARHKEQLIAMLHGHFHNGVRGWEDRGPLQEICFPSALYNGDRKLAEQKAPGYYLAEFRPGFVQVDVKAERLVLRYKPLGVTQTADRVCRFDA
jgi:calcineurin-like phosphoesterase family protein